ncbi:MAG: thiol-disulfide isomerase [Burkholderiales bacterium]
MTPSASAESATLYSVDIDEHARRIGLPHGRIAPMGALVMDSGPRVGEPAPAFELAGLEGLAGLAGRAVRIGAPGARQTPVFRLSPTGPVCKKPLPAIRSLARAEDARLRIVFASDGDDPAEHRRFVEREELQGLECVLSHPLGMALRVGKLPHAVLIAADGRVASKGPANSRERPDRLLLADDLGVSSVQAYAARRPPASEGGTGVSVGAARRRRSTEWAT